jgi:shikimate kinase
MARLVLIGMPGVGKTTVGRAVATALECDAIDLDELLSDTLGQSVADFIREHGVAPFRSAETAALRVALHTDGVVSCGGGVVTETASRELLQGATPVVWLTAPVSTLRERVGGGDRPLLGEDVETSLTELSAEREPLYRAVASFSVNADRPLRDVVDEIVAHVRK